MSTLRFSSLAKKHEDRSRSVPLAAGLHGRRACVRRRHDQPRRSTMGDDASDSRRPHRHATVPCGDIHTGYDGDEHVHQAAARRQGLPVPLRAQRTTTTRRRSRSTRSTPGKEVTDCVYFPTPNDDRRVLQRVPQPDAPEFAPHAALHPDQLRSPRRGRTTRRRTATWPGSSEHEPLRRADAEARRRRATSDGAPENDGAAVRIPAQAAGHHAGPLHQRREPSRSSARPGRTSCTSTSRR